VENNAAIIYKNATLLFKSNEMSRQQNCPYNCPANAPLFVCNKYKHILLTAKFVEYEYVVRVAEYNLATPGKL